ncbi:MAG: magnesium chelatase domain-containing protein, partial [Ferruginibacter sp.]
MLVKTFGCAVHGVDAIPITIEVDICQGLHYVIVGLPDNTVKESLSRVESAIKNCNYRMPRNRIVFNLAPADLKKTGSSFDLAMALGVLAASEQIPNSKPLNQYMIMGELSLDGAVQPVKGALPMAIQARKNGFKGVIVPAENAKEAGMVNKIKVFSVRHLTEVVDFFSGVKALEPVSINTREAFFATQYDFDLDFG